ncbi:hypothetical protein MRX96_013513 [Rhipicephalus microplus]
MTAAAATPPAGRVDVPASHRIDCRMGPEGGQFSPARRVASWVELAAVLGAPLVIEGSETAEFVWLAVLGETCDAFPSGHVLCE